MLIKEISPKLITAAAKAWKIASPSGLGWVESKLVSDLNEYFEAGFQSGNISNFLKDNPFYVLKPRKAGHGLMAKETTWYEGRNWALKITASYSVTKDLKDHTIVLHWATKSQANNPIRREVQAFYSQF